MDTQAPVSNIMSTELIKAKLDASFNEVLSLFDQNNIHHILVTSTNNQLEGIISKEDVLRAFRELSNNTSGKTFTQKILESWTAKDLMTNNPVVIEPEDTVGLVADMFLENKFHALAVIENFEVVGIVTSHDLIKLAYQDISFAH